MSHWETGRGTPDKAQRRKLEAALGGGGKRVRSGSAAQAAARSAAAGAPKRPRKRLRGLAQEAWFKGPLVEQAAFLAVEDAGQRTALQSLLVRTLRGSVLVRTRDEEAGEP